MAKRYFTLLKKGISSIPSYCDNNLSVKNDCSYTNDAFRGYVKVTNHILFTAKKQQYSVMQYFMQVPALGLVGMELIFFHSSPHGAVSDW